MKFFYVMLSYYFNPNRLVIKGDKFPISCNFDKIPLLLWDNCRTTFKKPTRQSDGTWLISFNDLGYNLDNPFNLEDCVNMLISSRKKYSPFLKSLNLIDAFIPII